MSSRLNFVRPQPHAASPLATPLPDGTVAVRYHQDGGALVIECCGQKPSRGRTHLAPETWRAWLHRGIDLVVEPDGPTPALIVRVTATSGRNLQTTAGVSVPVTGTARLAVRLLFADPSGMSFKIALGDLGAVEVDLADADTQIRPPPPKLPVDAPKAS